MISLLTYDAPHRKTQDVIARFLFSGIKFNVVATPWVTRKRHRPIFSHRPHEKIWPCPPLGHTRDLCRNLGIQYSSVEQDKLLSFLHESNPDVVVVGGAGILDAEIVHNWKVMNVHPGHLPKQRGLDTLKWSVVRGQKAGVTAHLVDEHVDLGWFLVGSWVPCYHADTFHSFAMRQYEIEIKLFGDAVLVARDAGKDVLKRIEAGDTTPTMRMKRRDESFLLDAFDRYKLLYAEEPR